MDELLEEIVGEITDEYDFDEPRSSGCLGGAFRVPGRTPPIDEVESSCSTRSGRKRSGDTGGGYGARRARPSRSRASRGARSTD